MTADHWGHDVPTEPSRRVKVIGLAGHHGAGRATVAEILRRDYGLRSFSIADEIRSALLILDPLVGPGKPLSDLVRELGWGGAAASRLYGAEVLSLMQRFGDGVREVAGEGVWITAMRGTIETGLDASCPPIVCFRDVRFDHEARWVASTGGQVWSVTRPGCGPRNAHESETGVDPALIAGIVVNDGTRSALRARVAALAAEAGMHRVPPTRPGGARPPAAALGSLTRMAGIARGGQTA